jgi:hypothetical protein
MRFRLITSEQLDEALGEKRETGRDVGAIVVERGWVNEDQLARLLSYAPAFVPPAEQAEAVIEPALQVEADEEPAFAAPALSEEPVAVESAPAPEQEPELESDPTFPAGPVISAAADVPADAPPALEPAPAITHQIPPALELVEPDSSFEPAPSFEAEPTFEADTLQADPFVEAEASFEAGPSVDLEPRTVDAPEPVAEQLAPVAEVTETRVELAPIAPVVSTPEPVAEPAADVEVVAAPDTAVEATSASWQPAPDLDSSPVAVEPLAAPALAPAPEPTPEPAAVAPEPQTVRFVEPAAIETIARVFVRLSNGERVEAGSFDDIATAKTRAGEVVRQVSNGEDGWPFFGGRYIRPEAIVSVDIDATVVRYA